jgi:hypothetical protein
MLTRTTKSLVLIAALSPGLIAAKGKGCGGDGNDNTIFSTSPAPDMSGSWQVSYDDRLDIEITLGGAVYERQLGAQGGTITIDHDGQPITFNLDCTRPEVVCPSEVWPATVTFRQDDPTYPHRVWMKVPQSECQGQLVDPDPATCGPNTHNPDCEKVCDGESVTNTHESFGTIDEPGEEFWLALGAGIASNGINCVLLGGSFVDGNLVTEGSAEGEDWEAVSASGDVVTNYAGGCLWAGDPNMDGQLEALVLGASVRFATGFTATR